MVNVVSNQLVWTVTCVPNFYSIEIFSSNFYLSLSQSWQGWKVGEMDTLMVIYLKISSLLLKSLETTSEKLKKHLKLICLRFLSVNKILIDFVASSATSAVLIVLDWHWLEQWPVIGQLWCSPPNIWVYFRTIYLTQAARGESDTWKVFTHTHNMQMFLIG